MCSIDETCLCWLAILPHCALQKEWAGRGNLCSTVWCYMLRSLYRFMFRTQRRAVGVRDLLCRWHIELMFWICMYWLCCVSHLLFSRWIGLDVPNGSPVMENNGLLWVICLKGQIKIQYSHAMLKELLIAVVTVSEYLCFGYCTQLYRLKTKEIRRMKPYNDFGWISECSSAWTEAWRFFFI